MNRISFTALSLVLVLGCSDDPVTRPDAGRTDAGPTDGGATDGSIPDGGPPPTVGWHAGGRPSAIAIDGTVAYVAIGPRITVWDVSDLDAPTQVRASPPFDGLVEALAYGHDRLYAAVSSDLHGHLAVLDDSLRVISTVELGARPGDRSWPVATTIAGDRLYVGDTELGVLALELREPDAPEVVDRQPETSATMLRVVGDRIYAGEHDRTGGAYVLRVLDRATLDRLGEHAYVGVLTAAVADGDAVVLGGFDGIFALDARDLSNVHEIWRESTTDTAFASTVEGTTVWVADQAGVHAIDVSDPELVNHRGSLAVDVNGTLAIARVPGGLLAASWQSRLASIAIEDGRLTTHATVALDACSNCTAVESAGATIYAADFGTGVVALSGELGPRGRLAFDASRIGIEGIVRSDERLYVADWAYGLRIVGASDPTALVELGGLTSSGAPSAVDVAGDLVFLGESTGGGALRTIDASDPSAPVALASVETSKVRELVVHGDRAYVADESIFGPGGLRIFDVSDPTEITQIGHYVEGCANALDVAIDGAGALAIVACDGDGWHVVDVSDPASPVRLSTHEVPGGHQATAVAVGGSRVALGHSTGFAVRGYASGVIGDTLLEASTPQPVRDLELAGANRVIAAAGLAGVYQRVLRD